MLVEPWLPRAAALHPDRHAVETPDGALTYAELLARARAGAAELAGARTAPIALPAGLDFAVALHAALLAGVPAVPVDLRLSEAERAARARTEPSGRDGVVAVIHTSGTTAAPKRVELTADNWWWNAVGSALALGLDPDERWLCTLPLAHVGGLSILIRSTIYATTAVVHPRFDAGAAVRALMEERITVVSVVATTLQRLLDAGLERPPHLRVALLGGGPAPAPLLERAAAAGVPVAQTYGMTETCSQAATSLPGEPETAGRALAGARIEIAGDGEVLVAGPTVAPGAVAADGWLHTGDLGTLDDRGRLTVVGRKADTIVSGGENVAPAEVEAVLMGHPDVLDAAVYGRPDAEWGEAVVARIVPRPGALVDLETLRAHSAGRLAAFKLPKALEVTESLPRTPSGKLLRRELSEEAG
jgi:O-succinylbenzoic acid--CoA ligase